ncbi:ABC transporter ATP-binding protein [Verrucosispora sp. WMMD573]|uniref:ABC transporter ATP-binding protein n=1 Tax=Verrucosispora sp. WMMD573 TaxID=3015149 RepID=UPI00248BDF59|nr:ABC transporter ATP-binding protein [Verrucosispora sp. WMMD573]WBB53636.1 energy-coupling factor transporter ATPase [Verrucosispora sp. WMMD573]
MHQPLLSFAGVSVRHELPQHGDDVVHYGLPSPSAVSFGVWPGEAVLLLGPSGCGKSTLTLTSNGLIPNVVAARVAGAVRAAGRPVADHPVPTFAADVAMVFQDPDAQVVMATVLDEVCFGPENLRLPADEVLVRAEEALRAVGLWERRDDDPSQLSGGGRQRLAIACALALRAPLLVLDEPTANLDPVGVEEVHALLRRIVATGERAVLLVEHNLDTAVELVDRVVVLDDKGRLILDGPVRQVLTEHADRLIRLGVWLPQATLAALRLRRAGIELEPLPLTPTELGAALDAYPVLPAPPSAVADPVAPASRDEVAVEVSRLTVRRGRAAVLHEIDLAISAGELVAVVGPNGAGKTTLAQAIAGVTRPPRGTVRVAGVDPARVDGRTLAGLVGFVFQNPEHQFVTARVDDELAHGLRIRRVAEDEMASRVDDVLSRFGLLELRDRHPFLLSGGQKRRLSVATAIICRPRVLVLDEPTFGQDRQRAAELLELLTDLHRTGTTVVMVTHDMHLVAEHASRVVALVDGRVLADAPPAELFADAGLLTRAGLRPPPLARATGALVCHESWRAVTRLADLPTGAAGVAA